MIDFTEMSPDTDLPALDGEVSTLSYAQAQLAADVASSEEDCSGMRWLLERPEALIDVRGWGGAESSRRGRDH